MHGYETRKKANDLFKRGIGYKTVSRLLEIPLYTVREWKRRFQAGDTEFFTRNYVLPAHRDFNKETRKAAIAYYASCGSLKQTARAFKTSSQTISNWLKKAQIPVADLAQP